MLFPASGCLRVTILCGAKNAVSELVKHKDFRWTALLRFGFWDWWYFRGDTTLLIAVKIHGTYPASPKKRPRNTHSERRLMTWPSNCKKLWNILIFTKNSTSKVGRNHVDRLSTTSSMFAQLCVLGKSFCIVLADFSCSGWWLWALMDIYLSCLVSMAGCPKFDFLSTAWWQLKLLFLISTSSDWLMFRMTCCCLDPN